MKSFLFVSFLKCLVSIPLLYFLFALSEVEKVASQPVSIFLVSFFLLMCGAWFFVFNTVYSLTFGSIIFAIFTLTVYPFYRDGVYGYEGKFFNPQSLYNYLAFKEISPLRLSGLKVTNPAAKAELGRIVNFHILKDQKVTKDFLVRRLSEEKFLEKDPLSGELKLSALDKEVFNQASQGALELALITLREQIRKGEKYNKVALDYLLQTRFKEKNIFAYEVKELINEKTN